MTRVRTLTAPTMTPSAMLPGRKHERCVSFFLMYLQGAVHPKQQEGVHNGSMQIRGHAHMPSRHAPYTPQQSPSDDTTHQPRPMRCISKM